MSNEKPDVLHYNCPLTKLDNIAGSPEFKPTGRSGKEFDAEQGNEPGDEDTTEVYECEGCDATVGLELVDGKWTVYL